MTRSQPPAPILTVDLRLSADRAFADALADGAVDSIGVSSRVLVIEHTDTMIEYQAGLARLAALPQVTAVILVAVGPAANDVTGPRLRPPAALRGVGVTLWVGDESGVWWQGGPPVPGRGTLALSDLLTALRLPAVFDRVFTAVREMPNQTASPGLEISYAIVEPGAMRMLKIRALQAMTAVGLSARQHDRVYSALVAATSPARIVDSGAIRPESAMFEARAIAAARLAAADRALTGLHGWRGLFGGGPGGAVVLSRLADAAAAVREHGRMTTRMVQDIESNLAEGYPTANELVERGLPTPATVDSVQLADSLRVAFAAELTDGRTLPGLADQARRLANRFDGVRDVRHDETDNSAALRAWARPPLFRLWPMPILGLLPVVLCSTLGAAWLPGIGVPAGIALAAGWLAVVALLIRRRPVAVGSASGMATVGPVATVAGAAVVGAVGGRPLPALPGFGIGPDVAVVAALIVIAVVGVVMAWNTAVRAWTALLPVAVVVNLNRRIAERLDKVIVQRWLPAETNRRLADSLLVIATGLDAADQVFRDLIDLHRVAADNGREPPSVDTASELAAVLHQDLVTITLNVLQPCFEQIASRSPLTGGDRWLVDRARDAVGEYNYHLDHVGFRELPPGITDDASRRRLAATLWRNSAVSRRILHAGPRGEMTQFCRNSDLRLLDTTVMTHLYFASSDVVDLPEATIGPDVIMTQGDAVGALRLVGLRGGIVEHTVPVSDLAQVLGESGESDEPASG